MAERTFIAIKPDGVKRNLIGRIITRFEEKGYKIIEKNDYTDINLCSYLFNNIYNSK